MKLKRWIAGALAGVLAFTMVGTLPTSKISEAQAATASVYDFNYGGGITWSQADTLPTFAERNASERIDAIDTAGMDVADKYTAVSLQGLVNRERARLLVSEDRNGGRAAWFNDLIDANINWISLDTALSKYKSCVQGMVVYDATNEHSLNVATAVAGAESSIVVSYGKEGLYQQTYGFQPKVNLIGQVGYSAVGAYNWLYDNYYKNGKLNTRLIVTLHPTGHKTYVRDLAVATKAAVLWLDPTKSEECAVLDKFFNAATPGVTYNLGWWPDEDPGIVYTTRKGVSTVPSDYFENVTFYMSQSKEIDLPTVPAKPKLENKAYIALMFADGDNTQYNQGTMYDSGHWNSRWRKRYPISWTCSPALYYMAPQMLQYFYETAGTDMLVCGPSGFGYTKATRWREKAGFLNQFAAVTNAAFEKCGMNIITIWDRVSQGSYAQFAAHMPSLLGCFVQNHDWNDADSSAADTMYLGYGRYLHYPENRQVDYASGKAIFGIGPDGTSAYCRSTDNARSDIIGRMANYQKNEPIFIVKQFVPWDVDTKAVTQMAQELKDLYGDDIEFVRADHLLMLMNEHNNMPYNVGLRAKASASTTAAGTAVGNAVDGSATTGWKATTGSGSWYQLDLGERCEISSYTLKNDETGYAAASANTKAYRFQYSLNGSDWVTADTVTGNTKAILYRTLSNTVAARYVRVLIDDAGADSVAAVQELEVNGVKLGVTDDNAPVTVTKIKFNTPKSILNQNYTMQTSAVVSPSNATNKKINYASSNNAVAKIDANGKVTALKKGTTTLKATAADGSGTSASAWLEVRTGKVEEIKLNAKKKTLAVGKTFTAKAVVTPTTAVNRAVKWTTSDKKVATVTQTGKIKAKGAGVATITAKAKDGSGKKATIKITVKPNQVKSVKVQKKSKKFVVTYKKAKGAGSYEIWMKTGSGKYKKIGTTKKVKFTTKTLKKGKKYSFKVRAIRTRNKTTVRGKYSKATKAKKL